MPDPERQARPSFGGFISNWKAYDAPVGTKLRMAASNTWTKVRKHQGCCGNHGQPGC